jgi:hypothetical protein
MKPLMMIILGSSLQVSLRIISLIFFFFFASCVWFSPRSVGYPVPSMDFLPWCGSQVGQSLVGHSHKFCITLPQHILQTGQTVG